MKEKIKKLREKVIDWKSERKIYEQQLANEQVKKNQLEHQLEIAQKARVTVQFVAEQTQKKIEYHISNLVSLALASVFDDPYEFLLRFTQRRNKTECDLMFTKNEKEIDLFEAAGYGAVDIANFALRAAIWSIHPSRNTQLLDEPFRNLSSDYHEKASEMVKKVSDSLELQIIMVTHQKDMISAADKVIEVEKDIDGISQIK